MTARNALAPTAAPMIIPMGVVLLLVEPPVDAWDCVTELDDVGAEDVTEVALVDVRTLVLVAMGKGMTTELLGAMTSSPTI
ncbi:hypothetical protein BC829DRAFT_269137 [Chytridium lagenaria]|nr:hypothetical protein BC829DRAFT_269137 [Chytridium lagenaria]